MIADANAALSLLTDRPAAASWAKRLLRAISAHQFEEDLLLGIALTRAR
jgi:hypothetical protein